MSTWTRWSSSTGGGRGWTSSCGPGKVAREMRRAQGTLPPAELAERTGLTEAQVHLAVLFHNARAAEVRRRREH